MNVVWQGNVYEQYFVDDGRQTIKLAAYDPLKRLTIVEQDYVGLPSKAMLGMNGAANVWIQGILDDDGAALTWRSGASYARAHGASWSRRCSR